MEPSGTTDRVMITKTQNGTRGVYWDKVNISMVEPSGTTDRVMITKTQNGSRGVYWDQVNVSMIAPSGTQDRVLVTDSNKEVHWKQISNWMIGEYTIALDRLALGQEIAEWLAVYLQGQYMPVHDVKYSTNKDMEKGWLVNWLRDNGWYLGGIAAGCGGHPPVTAGNEVNWAICVVTGIPTSSGDSNNDSMLQLAFDIANGLAYMRKGWKSSGSWQANWQPIGGSPAVMSGASSIAAGAAGLVPAPAKNEQNLFLRGDGNWATPPTVSTQAAGFAPKLPGKTNQFLRGDGTWAEVDTGTGSQFKGYMKPGDYSQFQIAASSCAVGDYWIAAEDLSGGEWAPTQPAFSKGDILVMENPKAIEGTLYGTWNFDEAFTVLRGIHNITVNGAGLLGNTITNFGTCTTTGSAPAKVSSYIPFTLIDGAEVTIKFTNANTAATPTLNVNNTGDIPMYYQSTRLSTQIKAGMILTFRYIKSTNRYEVVGALNNDGGLSISGTAGNLVTIGTGGNSLTDSKVLIGTGSGGFGLKIGTGTTSFATYGVGIGHNVSAGDGVAIGNGAKVNGYGAALSEDAVAYHGASIGQSAMSENGGAIGQYAYAINGGAVGANAEAGNGFSGGHNAKVATSGEDCIDAVQLGTGMNDKVKTLKVYDYQVTAYDGDYYLADVGPTFALQVGKGGTIVEAINLLNTAINSKADKTVASSSANGLMSANDKVKLDSLALVNKFNYSSKPVTTGNNTYVELDLTSTNLQNQIVWGPATPTAIHIIVQSMPNQSIVINDNSPSSGGSFYFYVPKGCSFQGTICGVPFSTTATGAYASGTGLFQVTSSRGTVNLDAVTSYQAPSEVTKINGLRYGESILWFDN